MGCLKTNQFTCNQTSLYDRVKKLLVSYDWSDCNFSVSGKSFKAHKLILGISSPVFEAMFYGPLSSSEDIIITDIQPDIFQLLLNYIYTDTVEIDTVDQAFELLYASKKYLLKHLSELCITHIESNLSVDNVIDVLNYPDYMQDQQLMSFAVKLFCEHANYLLKEKKCLITYNCLKAVLESDHMNISEKDLIKHVFEWSSYCCKQDELPDMLENRREILNKNGLFDLLRFYTLSLDGLNEVASDKYNLLLPYEFDNIKRNIINSNIKGMKMIVPTGVNNIIPRKLMQLQIHLCYRCPMRSVPPLKIYSNNYMVQSRIKANKSVFINSVCVPTRMAPVQPFFTPITRTYTEQFSVSITCESDERFIHQTNFKSTVKYDSIVDIELTEPCFIKKDEWYKISFVWPRDRAGTYLYLVEFRQNHYKGNKASFEFDDLAIHRGTIGSFLSHLKFCL